jgi:hypothetical protein
VKIDSDAVARLFGHCLPRRGLLYSVPRLSASFLAARPLKIKTILPAMIGKALILD